MKKTLTYPTQGTCSQAIIVTVEGSTIEEVSFVGGCHGNTQGVAALVRGMRIEEAAERLAGIDCRGRGTSCPDQLACALRSVEID